MGDTIWEINNTKPVIKQGYYNSGVEVVYRKFHKGACSIIIK